MSQTLNSNLEVSWVYCFIKLVTDSLRRLALPNNNRIKTLNICAENPRAEKLNCPLASIFQAHNEIISSKKSSNNSVCYTFFKFMY